MCSPHDAVSQPPPPVMSVLFCPHLSLYPPSQSLRVFLHLLSFFFPPFPRGGPGRLCSPVANLTVLLANLAVGALCVCVLHFSLASFCYTTLVLASTYKHLACQQNIHTYMHARRRKMTAFIAVSFMHLTVNVNVCRLYQHSCELE